MHPTSITTPPVPFAPRASAETTVNALLATRPHAARVLNAFGVDTCCGGHLTLREAARVDRLDLLGLLGALDTLALEATA